MHRLTDTDQRLTVESITVPHDQDELSVGKARLLAAAAICAGQQERYWNLHSAWFQARPSSQEELLTIAESNGLDREQFALCIDAKDEVEWRIERDIAVAKRLGLNGTPAFAIGTVSEGSTAVAVKTFVNGAQPLAIFEDAFGTMQ